jgi:cellulose synthase (UDP-forming)
MNAEVDSPAPILLIVFRYTLLLLTCVTAAIYFQWRLGVMNPAFLAYAWIVFAAELVGFTRSLLFLLAAVRVPHHEVPPPPVPGLSIDVFIPTYDEPVDVVRRTLLGALAIRYPHETWLLDDGERAEMRDLASTLGCRYVARTEHSNAKAGNLNHALALAGGDFVAIFDADHIADPQFLERTLGYFADEGLAFVQTPQEFFNANSFEHLAARPTMSNGASLFHHVVQRSRDRSNSTIFTGSSAVLRRRALDGIGGFTTGTISEDVHTSFRLHASGWRSIFHPETLSAGMAPLGGAAYCGQRLRWAQDSLQLLLRENVVAHPGLTARQRIAYLIHVASNLEGWRHVFNYALPVVMLVTGIIPVQTDAATFLAHFLPYFLVTSIAYSELARGHGRPDESAVYNLARCPMSIVAAFTAYRERRFRVTPKTRGPQRRLPASRFTEAILVVTLAAIACACAQAVVGRSPFPGGTLAVIVTWAAYHVVTAARLLRLERRCEHDRRMHARFAEDLPATIARDGDPGARYTVDVVVASADGLTLRMRDGTAYPPAGDYHGELDLAGTRIPFALTMCPGSTGGPIRWADESTRIALDLLLHQRAIQRIAGAQRGDRGGVFRPAGVSRPRYPRPRPSRVLQKPETPPASPS